MSRSYKNSTQLPLNYFQSGFVTIKSIWPQWLNIIFFTTLLPYFVFIVFYDKQSLEITSVFSSNASQHPPLEYSVLLDPAMRYWLSYLASYSLLSLLFLIAFFAFFIIAINYYRGEQPKTFFALLKTSLTTVIFRGLIVALVFVLLFITSQVFFPPLTLFLAPFSLGPLLLLVEHKSSWQTIKLCLTLRFSRLFSVNPWQCLFHLITLCAFYYLFTMLALWVEEFLLSLDNLLSVKRNIWLYELSFTFLPVARYVAAFFKVTILALATACLSVFVTSLFYCFKNLKAEIPADGI